MTAKEKANQLLMNYYNQICDLVDVTNGETRSKRFKIVKPKAKQCALIAVDEMLKELEDIDDGQTMMPYGYWQEVKTEIEKL
jgi:hypothetical protein